MGNVIATLKNGNIALIQDVWYAPDMKRNLMNVGQLIEKGISVTMKDNLLKLYGCNQKLVMKSEYGRNMTFKVNVKTTDSQFLNATSFVMECELQHKRLGNLNFRSLRHLSSKKLVHGIPKIVAPDK